MVRLHVFVMAALLAVIAGQAPSEGVVLATVEEVLDSAFPGARATRETIFLDREQRQEAERRAGAPVGSRLVTRYTLVRGGKVVGWAYLDTHTVRTLPETLLVLVGPDGGLLRVEVVTFREPREYLPPPRWYAQMEGLSLGDELALKGGVRPITGATLSARAAVEAARRVLAIHAVLGGGEAG